MSLGPKKWVPRANKKKYIRPTCSKNSFHSRNDVLIWFYSLWRESPSEIYFHFWNLFTIPCCSRTHSDSHWLNTWNDSLRVLNISFCLLPELIFLAQEIQRIFDRLWEENSLPHSRSSIAAAGAKRNVLLPPVINNYSELENRYCFFNTYEF